MGRREDVLALYRRGLRLSRNFMDPCGRNYLVNRVTSVFRRYKYEVSEKNITRYLHDARQAVRRLGKVISGDKDSIRYVLELAYGKRGRIKHLLKNAVLDAGKKKGPLYALSVIKDADAQSAVLRAAMSRVPGQTWKNLVIPRQRPAAAAAAAAAAAQADNGPDASRTAASSEAGPSRCEPPASSPVYALTVAWEVALWQSLSLKAWRSLVAAEAAAAPAAALEEPAVYRTPPPPGAISYAASPSFSDDWEDRHLQLLKRVFIPALPAAAKGFPRDYRRMYEDVFGLERPQAKIMGLPDAGTAAAVGDAGTRIVRVLYKGKPVVSYGKKMTPVPGEQLDHAGVVPEVEGSDAAGAASRAADDGGAAAPPADRDTAASSPSAAELC